MHFGAIRSSHRGLASGVAGGGVCVVSEEGVMWSQNNGVL